MVTRNMGKLTKRTNKTKDTEYSRELAKDTSKTLGQMEGKSNNMTERPANFDIYPGE